MSDDQQVNDFAQEHGVTPQRALEMIAEAAVDGKRADEIEKPKEVAPSALTIYAAPGSTAKRRLRGAPKT